MTLAHRAPGGRPRLAGRVRHRRGRPARCAAPATCSGPGSRGCRRCGWHRCSSRATCGWPSGRGRWPTASSVTTRALAHRPELARLQADFARGRGRGGRRLMRVIAGTARGVPLVAPRDRRHAADHRPREGDAVRDPRRSGARRPRARPVRRQRRDRDRGALARGDAPPTSSSVTAAPITILARTSSATRLAADAARPRR